MLLSILSILNITLSSTALRGKKRLLMESVLDNPTEMDLSEGVYRSILVSFDIGVIIENFI